MSKKIYRVEFKCYHYNTGYADNYTFMAREDFITIDDAMDFRNKLIAYRKIVMDYSYGKITAKEAEDLHRKLNWSYAVEDGYVSFSVYGELPTITEVIITPDIETRIV